MARRGSAARGLPPPRPTRRDEPGVELVTVGMGDAEALGVATERREPAASVARQRAQPAILDGVHFARAASLRGDGDGRGRSRESGSSADRRAELAPGRRRRARPVQKRCSPLDASRRTSRPSGDHSAAVTPPSNFASCRGSPPANGSTHGWTPTRARCSLPSSP
jgi:hypothetical protein